VSFATHAPNLASSRGKWNEAEQLEIQVMDMRKKLLGAETSRHPHHYGKSSRHIPTPFSIIG
jgi:hypothetical protein